MVSSLLFIHSSRRAELQLSTCLRQLSEPRWMKSAAGEQLSERLGGLRNSAQRLRPGIQFSLFFILCLMLLYRFSPALTIR